MTSNRFFVRFDHQFFGTIARFTVKTDKAVLPPFSTLVDDETVLKGVVRIDNDLLIPADMG